MSLNTQVSPLMLYQQANAVVGLFNTYGGFILVCNGTQPTSCYDTTVSSANVGVVLTLPSNPFTIGAPTETNSDASGTLTLSGVAMGTANFTGGGNFTPTWARLCLANTSAMNGLTATAYTWGGGTNTGYAFIDVSAGASGANMTIASFASGTIVTCTSFTHSLLQSFSGSGPI
jgi:hypothetical protein